MNKIRYYKWFNCPRFPNPNSGSYLFWGVVWHVPSWTRWTEPLWAAGIAAPGHLPHPRQEELNRPHLQATVATAWGAGRLLHLCVNRHWADRRQKQHMRMPCTEFGPTRCKGRQISSKEITTTLHLCLHLVHSSNVHTCWILHLYLVHLPWLSGLCVPPQRAGGSSLLLGTRLGSGGLVPRGSKRKTSSGTRGLHYQTKIIRTFKAYGRTR